MHLASPDSERIVRSMQRWLEVAVIGLNLCPFAKAVHVRGQIRYAVSAATDRETLLQDLRTELSTLSSADPEQIDTTLLIHPDALHDFYDYNDFLRLAQKALRSLRLDGVIQIASFHPQYQFADADSADVQNYTNRAPFPALHLLRECSVARAVAAYPDASAIYQRNIATMQRLGAAGWSALGIEPLTDQCDAPEL